MRFDGLPGQSRAPPIEPPPRAFWTLISWRTHQSRVAGQLQNFECLAKMLDSLAVGGALVRPADRPRASDLPPSRKTPPR